MGNGSDGANVGEDESSDWIWYAFKSTSEEPMNEPPGLYWGSGSDENGQVHMLAFLPRDANVKDLWPSAEGIVPVMELQTD